MKNFAVILAGGKGERFWPASRSDRPKQLLRLLSDKTMLEETIARVDELVEPDDVLIVTSDDLRELIEKEISHLQKDNFLIEPVGKNTAPAIGLAAANILARHDDGVMIVLSSDHRIKPVDTFQQALSAATEVAMENDKLLLIGIEPTRPETGYGYIQLGPEMMDVDGFTIYDVASFREKPNRLLAQEYYLDGQHLWNSGIFVWRASVIMKEMERALPEQYSLLMKYREAVGTANEKEVLEKAFEEISSISIDYGVLEKSRSVAALRAKFTWDDVGSFSALERITRKDFEGNVVIGDEIVLHESFETTIMNEASGPIVTFGVSDIAIIRTKDALLVIHKTRIPQMRELLDSLKDMPEMEEYL